MNNADLLDSIINKATEVQAVAFESLKNHIQTLENQIEQLKAEKQTLQEQIDGLLDKLEDLQQ